MLDLIKSYNEACRADKAKLDAINAEIRSLKRRLGELQEEEDKVFFGRSWVSGIVEPLAKELAERSGLGYEIFGPFGMRCETTIYLRADMDKSITEQETRSLILTPYTEEDGTETVMCWPDGLNRMGVPLPGTIGEVEALLHTNKPSTAQ